MKDSTASSQSIPPARSAQPTRQVPPASTAPTAQAGPPAHSAKFRVGQHVNHPIDPNKGFQAGTGVIATVTISDDANENTYTVVCDKTQAVLPCSFKECDLSLV